MKIQLLSEAYTDRIDTMAWRMMFENSDISHSIYEPCEDACLLHPAMTVFHDIDDGIRFSIKDARSEA